MHVVTIVYDRDLTVHVLVGAEMNSSVVGYTTARQAQSVGAGIDEYSRGAWAPYVMGSVHGQGQPPSREKVRSRN